VKIISNFKIPISQIGSASLPSMLPAPCSLPRAILLPAPCYLAGRTNRLLLCLQIRKSLKEIW
jgi:hypothetical protein